MRPVRWVKNIGDPRADPSPKRSPFVQDIPGSLQVLQRPMRDPVGIDSAHRRGNFGRPTPVHLLLPAGLELPPSGPRSEEFDGPYELRPLALQELPAGAVQPHAFKKPHAPFIDDLNSPTASRFVKGWGRN